MGELSDPPRVRVRLADIRLEKHPLKIEGDLFAVKNIQNDSFVGQSYLLNIISRCSSPTSVILSHDSAWLENFSVSFSPERFVLQPGESREVIAEIKAAKSLVKKLPPLYSERAAVFAATEEYPELLTPWYQGFMLNYLVGAIPPEKKEYPWFKTDREKQETILRRAEVKPSRQAEELLKIPVEIPELRHGYSGAYMDPGPPRKPLHFHGPGKHFSERTRTYVDISSFPESVQKAAAFVHHAYLSEAAYTLAETWWQTGRKEFAHKAKQILLAYAERYPNYSPFSPYATGYLSRIGHAMLGEAWWFHRIPEAFDLLNASGVFSPEEKEKIIEGLIVPAMITLQQHRVAANQQAEINTASGKAALVAERWDYAALALDGEYGMKTQWKIDFDKDGFSMEKEVPYHLAALAPFVGLANCLEAMGVKVYDQNFKRLFDAPLAYEITGVVPRPDLYYWAYRHYQDPRYLPIVAPLLKKDELPTRTNIASVYSNSSLEAAGYTVLRTGDEKTGLKALTMNWGCPSHRGGQVLLNPYFFWKKNYLNEQVLRIGYGYEQSGFSYTAAAGNSIVRDGQRASMLRATQVKLLEGEVPAGRWTSPVYRPLYPGMEWSRSGFICNDSFILIDQIKNHQPARFDWIAYLPGEIIKEEGLTSWGPYPQLTGEGDGYQYFLNPEKSERQETLNPVRICYRLGSHSETLRGLLTLFSPPGYLIRAEAFVHWHPKLVPVVLSRFSQSSDLWLIAVYTGLENSQSPPEIEPLPVIYDGARLSETDGLAVRIKSPLGSFLLLTSRFSGEHTVAGVTMVGPLAVVKEKSKNEIH
ncbi:MAG: alginate lyase family protein [Candidatus Omnitrophica bacterium]|nr:alginate lyase family protein [Candidatus Omnitrophota bacterium]